MLTEAKSSQRLCLDVGGQNHISKAGIKMGPIAFIAGVLSSVSNHDLCTKLLMCIICMHNVKAVHRKAWKWKIVF